MIAYIKGILVSTTTSMVTIDVNGIGYAIYIPIRLLGELPAIGKEVLLYTSFIVREMSHTLYGFLNCQDRELFDVLLNISGVGPKLSLSIIGHLNCQELHTAILAQDFHTLCKVPGIGKKTAERLIVELKDKLHGMPKDSKAGLSFAYPLSTPAQDALLALINLGYQQGAAQKAIHQTLSELPDNADIALIITKALAKVK